MDSLGCNRIHELAVDVDLVLVDHDWQLRCGSGTFLGEKPDLQCRISGRLHKGLVETRHNRQLYASVGPRGNRWHCRSRS